MIRSVKDQHGVHHLRWLHVSMFSEVEQAQKRLPGVHLIGLQQSYLHGSMRVCEAVWVSTMAADLSIASSDRALNTLLSLGCTVVDAKLRLHDCKQNYELRRPKLRSVGWGWGCWTGGTAPACGWPPSLPSSKLSYPGGKGTLCAPPAAMLIVGMSPL